MAGEPGAEVRDIGVRDDNIVQAEQVEDISITVVPDGSYGEGGDCVVRGRIFGQSPSQHFAPSLGLSFMLDGSSEFERRVEQRHRA